MAADTRKNGQAKRDTKSLPLGNRRRRSKEPFIPANVLILMGGILCISLLFPFTSNVQVFDVLKEGEVAKETIIAPFTFDILKSPEEIERERTAARENVLAVFKYDTTVLRKTVGKLRTLQKSFLQLVDDKTVDSVKTTIHNALSKELADNTIQTLKERMYLFDDALVQTEQALTQGVSSVCIVSSQQQLIELRSQFNTTFERYLIYRKGFVTLQRDTVEQTVGVANLPVKEVVLENITKQLKNNRNFDAQALNSIYELIFVTLEPNVHYLEKETRERKERAANEVLKIKGKIIKDTEIVRKHQEVTPEVVEKLSSLRAAIQSLESTGEKQRLLVSNAARLLFALVPLLFLVFYLQVFHSGITVNVKHTLALMCIIVFQIVIVRVGLLIAPRLFEGTSELTQVMPAFLIPITIASMLVTILFNLELGFVVSLYIGIFFGITMGFSLSHFIYALLGGLVAGFTTREIRYRWDFFKGIPPVFSVLAVTILLWHMSSYKVDPMSIVQNVGLAMINAILSIFLVMMVIPVFENLFDITTDMTLVELSDMNNPVLKRLSIEAAGTYNHCVLVANLAESAAEKIGANALMARVAAYYHDIGKLNKTDYFVENVANNDKNKHHKLAPSMSALIISSHVKDGVELARKYKLPRVIQDAILQHHGTSTVSFFYEKAKELDPHKQVQEKDFRYPGPRPQTRENAIIMLADSVEAASRSLATSSPKLLRELVKKIIRDKFLASQLDQCDLTLRDLDEIVEGFMPILQGIFHTRIEYPTT